MADAPIRILLVDDHELIRSGLGSVIDLEPDLSVVGTAGNVSEALGRYDELKPDGRDRRPPAARRHRPRHRPERSAGQSDTTGLVVLTMHSGDEQIFAAMQAGASGFVGKDAPATEVVKAARHAAVSPRAFICAGLAGR